MFLETRRGFTILELIIVIALIGVILSVVLVATSGVKEKSRDAARMQNMNDIQHALNLYYANNSRFPIAPSATTITGTDVVSSMLENDGVISEGNTKLNRTKYGKI